MFNENLIVCYSTKYRDIITPHNRKTAQKYKYFIRPPIFFHFFLFDPYKTPKTVSVTLVICHDEIAVLGLEEVALGLARRRQLV